MTKIMKLGKNLVESYSTYEADRWLNVGLGRNRRIRTNNVLLKDIRLHSYVNDETMSALDNYAKYEKLNIYIKPLENDMFDDLSVTVYKKGQNEAVGFFPMKIKDGRNGVKEFFKELYTKIDDAVNPVKSTVVPARIKRTKSNDFEMYLYNIKDRFHNWKIEKIRNFVDECKNDKVASPWKVIGDVLEELHFNELHKN